MVRVSIRIVEEPGARAERLARGEPERVAA
jgi:hypothetical protein